MMRNRNHSKWSGAAALFGLALLLTGCSLQLNPYNLQTRPYELPFDVPNVSFAEISFDKRLGRVIVPAAETGALVLIDPKPQTHQVISGFSTEVDQNSLPGGSGSAVSSGDYIYAIDRAARTIKVIDVAKNAVVSTAAVEGTPDVIRFVPTTRELWVTVKDLEQIEVFSLSEGSPPLVIQHAVIPVPFGPEDLLIEEGRGLAYTNQPQSGTTMVIQVITRGVVATWGNGCSKARGLALDPTNGYLFVACEEGKLVMMDVHTGFQLTSQNYGGGLNKIAYNPELQHVYLPSPDSAILAIFGIEKSTENPTAPAGTPPSAAQVNETQDANQSGVRLVRLGTADTAMGAGCAAADNNNQVWVCDPGKGRLLVIKDTFPSSAAEAGQ